MKKINFALSLVLLSVFSIQAQGFKGGFSLGFPSEDTHTFSIIAQVSYLFEVEDNIMVGPFTGYSHSFGDDITITDNLGNENNVEENDYQYAPVGISGRYLLTENLYGGLDLGYAIGLGNANDGGFYYAPKIGFSISDSYDIIAAYRGVAVNGGSFNILSAGIEFYL